MRKNFGREVTPSDNSCEKISRKSSESKPLMNQEESGVGILQHDNDYESSEAVSSFSKTGEEKEISMMFSNKTTLNSHLEGETKEKIKKKKNKNVIKNNKGKFILSKKKLNLGVINEKWKAKKEPVEHNGSLIMNYNNVLVSSKGPLNVVNIHNKSSNLVFNISQKTDFSKGRKSCEKEPDLLAEPMNLKTKKTKIKGKVKKKNTKGVTTDTSQTDLTCNSWYDDDRGDYKAKIGEFIAYRFEIKQLLGKGSFGQVFKCWDHKEKEFVALKIIRNKKNLQYQANVEVKILNHLKDNDPDDTHNVIRMKEALVYKSHIWVIFELLSMNLYEFIKLAEFEGLSIGLIRRFTIQILYALEFFSRNKIIHWDLKPENILLKNK